MDYKPGDYVVHPAYGVGQIVAIEEMEFVEKRHKLFYRVEFGKTTIWVPVQVETGTNLQESQVVASLRPLQTEVGIRAITVKSDLTQYRKILESPPASLDGDFRKRQYELEKKLQNSSFQILCEVVRDLHALRGVKVLNNYEKNLFQRTSRSLNQEWAASSGVPVEETARLINAMLQKGSVK